MKLVALLLVAGCSVNGVRGPKAPVIDGAVGTSATRGLQLLAGAMTVTLGLVFAISAIYGVAR
jgi:hypothetical protein